MTIETIESRLLQHLGIPAGGGVDAVLPGEKEQDSPEAARLARARLLLAEVRRLAGQIGRIPENYPLHVVFVIRVISALLPWYTRPLTQFGQKVTESLDAIVDCLSLDVAGGGDAASRTTGRLPADSRSSMKTT